VLDAGVDPEGRPYVVMEMLEGRPLDGLLAVRGRLPIPDAVQLGRQLCETLAYVHARGVVHRDLKPSNVFLARDELGREVVKLFDFGIAGTREALPDERAHKLTRAGSVMGTPEYMAPEQIFAQPADHRADLYAVGVTLFECLTGDVPFSGDYPQVLLKEDLPVERASLPARRAPRRAARAGGGDRAGAGPGSRPAVSRRRDVRGGAARGHEPGAGADGVARAFRRSAPARPRQWRSRPRRWRPRRRARGSPRPRWR
jgi:serine/threonine protein kinase